MFLTFFFIKAAGWSFMARPVVKMTHPTQNLRPDVRKSKRQIRRFPQRDYEIYVHDFSRNPSTLIWALMKISHLGIMDVAVNPELRTGL
ncbi:MAG: hypothetical protein EA390_12675 [Balneolaceae bacterium]|nr:MAG: hypothetical protein EA390_12675 [Balneolaceae bacterium]